MRMPVFALAFTLALSGWPDGGDAFDIVLPNPELVGTSVKLVGCPRSECLGLWKKGAMLEPVYPAQLRLDIARVGSGQTAPTCVRGLHAIYDAKVPLAAVEAAVDKDYGKWAMLGNARSGVKLWRVHPDGPNGLGVQLRLSEEGLLLIYLPIGEPCR